MAVKTYDFGKVAVIINNTALTGFARDTGISIAYNENQFSTVKDNRGNTIRSKLNDTDAKVELTLTQDSLSNDILNNYAILDNTTNAGVFSITIQDNNGKSVFTSTTAWVEKIADSQKALELGTHTWIIHCSNPSHILNGIN